MRRPLCMVCLVFVMAVFLSVSFHPPVQADSSLQTGKNEYDGKTVRLAGKVYQKEHHTSISGGENFIIYLNQTAVSGETFPDVEERRKIQGVMCYMEKESDVPIGSMVVVEGKLQEFMQAANPGEFDSREYYRILKLDYKLKNARIVKQSEQYDKLQEFFYKIKEFWAGILDSGFDRDDAGIMKAVLLGDKSSLSDEIKELYKRSGILHIMAISGLHISLIGMGLYKLLKRLKVPGAAAAAVCVAVMWGYGSMTGMSVSAGRAVFMFGMKMTADMIGRTYDMLTALALSAVFILTEQPLYVKHSGFLLSFGAVAGIGIVLPFLEERLHCLGMKKQIPMKLIKGILPGAAIFLTTFPIQIYFYYQYCVYSVFLNLLIVPLMTLVMISGLAVLLIGTLEVIFSAAGVGIVLKAASAVGHLVLKFYTFSCEGVEKVPGAVWITGRPKAWQIVIYYGLLLGSLVFHYWSGRKDDEEQAEQKRTMKTQTAKKRLAFAGYTAVIAAGLGILTCSIERGVEITFLDVGQGDCICVRTDSGSRYLIDGGSTSKSEIGKYQITPFLKSQGANSLDMVFVSHGDKDHYSGIEELLESTDPDRIRIKCLVLPVTEKSAKEKKAAEPGETMQEENEQSEVSADIGIKDREEGCRRLEQLARKQGIPVRYIQAGDRIRAGTVEIECLNPQSTRSASNEIFYDSEDKNEQSEVLYLTYRDFSALFTGDVTGSNEKEMQERLEETAKGKALTLLKVAHHGSMYSTDADFLEMIKPAISVISCGSRNSYGHPHEELLERLEKSGTRIYNTAKDGAVTVWTDGRRVKVTGFLLDGTAGKY